MPSNQARANFEQKRKANRKSIYHQAHILVGAGKQAHPCIVWDVSEGGAKLSAETTQDVPDRFVLVLTANRKVHRFCQVQWRFDNRIGVRFLKGTLPEARKIEYVDVDVPV